MSHDSAHPHSDEASAHHPGYLTFFLVWITLLSLTGLTVAVAGVNLGPLALSVAALIATIKVGLVLYFFMHLKYEPAVLKVMFGFLLLVLLIIVVLTFFDVIQRYGS